jgi:hypothetical protein
VLAHLRKGETFAELAGDHAREDPLRGKNKPRITETGQ